MWERERERVWENERECGSERKSVGGMRESAGARERECGRGPRTSVLIWIYLLLCS